MQATSARLLPPDLTPEEREILEEGKKLKERIGQTDGISQTAVACALRLQKSQFSEILNGYRLTSSSLEHIRKANQLLDDHYPAACTSAKAA